MDSSSALLIVSVTGTGLVLCVSLFIWLRGSSRNKFRLTQIEEQQTKIAHQERLLYNSILNQEKERERIAKDLHDEVGSRLNAVHVYLHQLARKSPQTAGPVNDLLEIVGETLNTTHRISQDLLPPSLENFGLEAALHETIDEFHDKGQGHIYFQAHGDRPGLSNALIEVNLFRIVSGLLTERTTSCRPVSTRLRLLQQPDRINLLYKDELADPACETCISARDGYLSIIESRLHLIGGTYQANFCPNHGMTLNLEVQLIPISLHN